MGVGRTKDVDGRVQVHHAPTPKQNPRWNMVNQANKRSTKLHNGRSTWLESNKVLYCFSFSDMWFPVRLRGKGFWLLHPTGLAMQRVRGLSGLPRLLRRRRLWQLGWVETPLAPKPTVTRFSGSFRPQVATKFRSAWAKYYLSDSYIFSRLKWCAAKPFQNNKILKTFWGKNVFLRVETKV